MGARWLLCTLPLYGCDVIWRIDGVREASDASLFVCDRDQHDEDRDGIGDACDRCPGIVDDQADADDDGVGDACDPDSTVLHDIAMFVSFADGSPSWTMLGGNWMVKADSLVYDSVALTTYGIALYPGAVPTPPYVLEAHVAIDTMPAMTSVLAIATDADGDGDGVRCGAIRREGPIRDFVRAESPSGNPASESPIMPIAAGGFRLTMSYDPALPVRCTIAADNQSTGGATMVSLPAVPAAGTLSFRSLHVGASVEYIAIYKPR